MESLLRMYVCRLLGRRNPDDTRGEGATSLALAPTARVPFAYVDVVTSANSDNTCTLYLYDCVRERGPMGMYQSDPQASAGNISANNSMCVLRLLLFTLRKFFPRFSSGHHHPEQFQIIKKICV